MEDHKTPAMADVRDPVTTGCSDARLAWLEVSDQHLGAGPFEEFRRRKGLKEMFALVRRGRFSEAFASEPVMMVNPLEDFYYDREFAACVDAFAECHAGADKCTVVLNGDVPDFLAVTYRGLIEDPDHEPAAVEKITKILRGHAGYVDGLRRHIRRHNGYLVFVRGNHDQHLDFRGVQRVIVETLTGGDPALAARIVFADRKRDGEFFEDGVLFRHGNDAEPHNRIESKTSIVTSRFGVRLKHAALNKPIGSDMAVKVSNRIKVRKALVGRTREDPRVWEHFSKHDWTGGVFMGWVLLTFYVSELSKISWKRIKESFWAVYGTLNPYKVKPYARKLLESHAGAELVVCGHDHSTAKDEWYLNAGTWTLLYDIDDSKDHPFARHLAKIAVWTFVIFGLMAAFVPRFIDTDDRLRWVIGIGIAVAAFPIVRGIIKLLTTAPKIVEDPKLTFAAIVRTRDGKLRKNVMIYDFVTREIREYL